MLKVKCRLLNTLYHYCKISSNHCHLMLYEIERPQGEQDVRYIVVIFYRCLSNRFLIKCFFILRIAATVAQSLGAFASRAEVWVFEF